MAKPPLTFRRLSGLDRTGPPPPETQAGAPLRPWTIPNAIGYLRAALVPVFLILAFSSDSGTDALPAIIFAVAVWGDYADGIAARWTWPGRQTVSSATARGWLPSGRYPGSPWTSER